MAGEVPIKTHKHPLRFNLIHYFNCHEMLTKFHIRMAASCNSAIRHCRVSSNYERKYKVLRRYYVSVDI
jgi:hypothetical protein